MKKTSLFFILIFSVFFSYHYAFAYTFESASTTTSLSPTYIAGITGGGSLFAHQKYQTGDTQACGSGYWDISTTYVLGAVSGTPDYYGGGFDQTLTSAYSLASGSGSFPTYASIISSYGDGYYLGINNNMLGCSGYPSAFSPQGTGFIFFQISGGVVIDLDPFAPPPPVLTHFESIIPADGTTTSSTSVVAGASYYLNDPDPTNYTTAPVAIKLYLHRTDGIGTPDQSAEFDSLTYNSLTAISHTFTLPTNTTWEMRFDLSGDGYYFISPLGTPTTFHVQTDPSVGTSGYTTCSITDIAGCMQNALVFLFYPSSASLSQFNGLYNQFIHKPPFGYIVAIQSTLQNVNISGTSAFTLQSMPILTLFILF